MPYPKNVGYALLRNGHVFLRVEDFSTYMIQVSEADLNHLYDHGIDTTLRESIALEPQGDVQPEAIADHELRSFRDRLERSE